MGTGSSLSKSAKKGQSNDSKDSSSSDKKGQSNDSKGSSSSDKKGQSNDSKDSSSSLKRSNDGENEPENSKVRKTDAGDEVESPEENAADAVDEVESVEEDAADSGDKVESPAENTADPLPAGASGDEQQQQQQPQQQRPAEPRARVPQRSPEPPRLMESPSSRRLILDQQNQAYQASLQADREKELKKEKEREEKLKLEEAAKAMEVLKLTMKEEATQALPPEPVRTPGGGDEGIFTLQFRNPSTGISFRRNFRTTDTLQVLIHFVMSHASTPVPFHLVRRPNQMIPMEHPEINSTLHAMGFGVSEVLLVQDGEPEIFNDE